MERKSSKRRSATGGIVVEAVLWLAFLALLIPNIIEFVFLSNTYIALSQITREAVLTEVSVPSSALTSGPPMVSIDSPPPSFVSQESGIQNCLVAPAYREFVPGFDRSCLHTLVAWRVRRLIESNRVRLRPEDLKIVTRYTADNVMSVEIEAKYRGLFWLFDGIPLHGVASGGYVGS